MPSPESRLDTKNASRGDFAKCFQCDRQSVRIVGGINVNAEPLSAIDSLHTTGHTLDGFQAARDRRQIESHHQTNRGSR